MFNKVEICGVNTAKLETLGEAEKVELLKLSKSGDSYAREKLISGNLRLVLSVIQKFLNRGENADDLFQVGCIGLIKAVDNFDISQNVKFSTYAVPMIIGEIRRFLRDNNMVRVSRSIRDLAYRSLCEKERLGAKLGREPTLSEICAELNCHFSSDQESTAYQGPKVTEADIASALDAIITPVSIYEPIYSDGGDSVYLSDQLSDEEAGMDSWTENIALAEAMKALGERERNILMLRFYADKTQTEVAREIGISQAQVSRLEKSALGRIKKQL